MKKLHLTIILVLTFFAVIEGQRGGGRRSGSKSRSRSLGKRRSYGSSAALFGWDQAPNCTNATNVTECEQNFRQNSGGGIVGSIARFIIFATLAAFLSMCLSILSSFNLFETRNKKIEKAFAKLELKNYQTCSLSQFQIQKARDWFMNKKWTLEFYVNSTPHSKETSRIVITDIKSRQSNIFNLKMNMQDSIGPSDGTGVLIVNKTGLVLIMQKTYRNRNQAGQTGSYDLLLYKGTQDGEMFYGQWAYQNYQNNQNFSGKWQMYHQ